MPGLVPVVGPLDVVVAFVLQSISGVVAGYHGRGSEVQMVVAESQRLAMCLKTIRVCLHNALFFSVLCVCVFDREKLKVLT